MKGQPRSAFGRLILRVLSMRSLWKVEPWTGALSLDLPTAWSTLDRFDPRHDPEAAATLISSFERGAAAGWAKTLKDKSKHG